jgi:hypothetical protein
VGPARNSYLSPAHNLMPKHNNKYRFYSISQDLINFLRKDGKYNSTEFKHNGDINIYSHYGIEKDKKYSDKYIGIIIEYRNEKYFAPLSHDGDKK